MKSGIYAICGPNGRRYVGSSVDLGKRKAAHLRALRAGTHHTRALQRAFLKYGEHAFNFVVLELVPAADLLVREQFYFDRAPPRTLYNSALAAGNCLGVKHSQATRDKLSQLRKGSKRTPETCRKIAELKTGLVCSAETRAKISATKRGQLAGVAKPSNTSGACGVHFNARAQKWQAAVRAAGKKRYLGVYDTVQAAAAAIEAFRLHFGTQTTDAAAKAAQQATKAARQ